MTSTSPNHDTPSAADVARSLGISQEAVELVRSCELVDLHIETFLPVRFYGYDPLARHTGGPFGRHLFGHVDLPRAREGGLTGAMWSITTNPARTAGGRWNTFLRNVERVRAIVQRSGGALRLVRSHSEFREARASGAVALMLAIQGGHALHGAPEGPASVPDRLLTRVTLVHLTNSCYGATSSPHNIVRRHRGLSDAGRDIVRQLNAQRIFVDLAHIHPQGFWDAVEVHDRTQPLIVTHTGVTGVTPHWRNLSDDQLRAVADTGGTIGIIFEPSFLRHAGGAGDGHLIVDHMQHVIDVVGEDFVSIGSDYDGMISPTKDMADATCYPRLVQYMLERGWSESRVRKVLGTNFLRVWEALRP